MPFIELTNAEIVEIECRLEDSLGWQEYSIDNGGSVLTSSYMTLEDLQAVVKNIKSY